MSVSISGKIVQIFIFSGNVDCTKLCLCINSVGKFKIVCVCFSPGNFDSLLFSTVSYPMKLSERDL